MFQRGPISLKKIKIIPEKEDNLVIYLEAFFMPLLFSRASASFKLFGSWQFLECQRPMFLLHTVALSPNPYVINESCKHIPVSELLSAYSLVHTVSLYTVKLSSS